MAKSIEIDMRLFKMIARKKGTLLNLNLLDYETTSADNKGTAAAGSGPMPMEIDAIRTSFRTPPPNSSQGAPCPCLTQDKKECCHRENLCLYCGQPNHMAVNCLKKSSNAQGNHSLMKTTTTAAATAPSDGPVDSGKASPQM